MPIPGYRAFEMGCALFSDLFPDRANEIDGDDKDMVRIDEALQEACLYGEGAADPEVRIFPSPGCQINVIDRRDGNSLGVLEMGADYRLCFCREDGVLITLTDETSLDAAFARVLRRRIQQDRQWGGPGHDDTHTWGDWTRYIIKFNDRGAHAINHADFEQQMEHIAALAVAAIQSSQRKRAPLPCECCLGDASKQHTCCTSGFSPSNEEPKQEVDAMDPRIPEEDPHA